MIMEWNNWLYADRLGEEKQTPRPQTNADRIRAMSDEELATFLGSRPLCPKQIGECPCDCGKCWIEWLKQPAE